MSWVCRCHLKQHPEGYSRFERRRLAIRSMSRTATVRRPCSPDTRKWQGLTPDVPPLFHRPQKTAGIAILRGQFEDESVNSLGLLLAALVPTLIAALAFKYL